MSIRGFQHWIGRANKAQRVHEDEHQDTSVDSVTMEAREQGLVLSRQLTRDVRLEARPEMAPSGPQGPKAPGMGAGSQGGTRMDLSKIHKPKPPRDKGGKGDR